MLQFIPEGKRNASKITLEHNIGIMVWKEKVQDKYFGLKWAPVTHGNEIFRTILNSPFKSISGQSCFPFSTIKYECRNSKYPVSNVQDYIMFLQTANEKDLNRMKLTLTVDKFEDLYNLDFSHDCSIKIKFKGNFYEEIKNRYDDDVRKLCEMPDCSRYYAQDCTNSLLIIRFLSYKRELCKENEFIQQFVNQKNAKFVNSYNQNVFHYAFFTNNLEIINNIINYGGIISDTKDNDDKYPSDYIRTRSIKDYVNRVRKQQLS